VTTTPLPALLVSLLGALPGLPDPIPHADIPHAGTLGGDDLPSTVTVDVGARFGARSLDILSTGCTAEGAGAGPLVVEVAGKSVRACGGMPRTCVARPDLRVQCRENARVAFDGGEQRTYGRAFRIASAGDRLSLVTTVDLEAYVEAVTLAEMRAAPSAALAAQAIAVRTYAAFATSEPRHEPAFLCDRAHCQVFPGLGTFPAGEADASISEPDVARSAIQKTRGQVLRGARGDVALVFFHSTCGGKTLDAHEVFGQGSASVVPGVDDVDEEGHAYCQTSPYARWTARLPDDDVARALVPLTRRPLVGASLVILPQASAAPSFSVSDGHGSIGVRGTALQRALAQRFGWGAVKSATFQVRREGRSLVLDGVGLGHRVGLCQYGAIERARRGQTAEQILKAYFPGLTVVGIEDEP
jgi:stage II sporulation protein D